MRGRGLLVLVLVALVVGVGPAAWGQKVPRATCLDCHLAEGMRYAVIQATPFIEVPMGETQETEVLIGNPWLHDITSALVTADLTGAPGLSFDTPDPFNLSETHTLGPQDPTVDVPFEVLPGVTGVVVRMEQPSDPTPLGLADVDLIVGFPEGEPARTAPDGVENNQNPASKPQDAEQLAFEGDALANRPTGAWNATLTLSRGPPETPVDLSINVFYNATRTQSQLLTDELEPGESGTVTFLVRGLEASEAKVDFRVVITSYYLHPKGIGAQDEGNATMRRGLNFTVGEQLELGEAGPPVPPTPPISWKLNARIWGEATGFVGLFLVPLSLLLGGAFGRRNVLWINKVTRSARLRVLWHNSLSWILLGISLLHLFLFLYEEVYDWSVGFVWGGIGTLALVGLGLTGGYQRRLARSIGYANWRLLHIAMAVLFVASVLVHVLVDGAHFDVFRNWLRLT